MEEHVRGTFHRADEAPVVLQHLHLRRGAETYTINARDGGSAYILTALSSLQKLPGDATGAATLLCYMQWCTSAGPRHIPHTTQAAGEAVTAPPLHAENSRRAFEAQKFCRRLSLRTWPSWRRSAALATRETAEARRAPVRLLCTTDICSSSPSAGCCAPSGSCAAVDLDVG